MRTLWTPSTLLGIIVFIHLSLAFGQDSPFPGEETYANAKAGDLFLKSGTYEIKGKVYEADYGTLVVPENRQDPESRTITLPVIRIKTDNETETEPVFYLNGGPGYPNVYLPKSARWMGLLGKYGTFLTHHDLVLVGYRGVEGSVILDAPEVTKVLGSGKDTLSTDTIQALGEGLNTAFRRMHKEGIDLDAYNVEAVIDDLETARMALDYERINLFGVSFGTLLGYVYSVKYPNSIQRSIMGVGIHPRGQGIWEPEDVEALLEAYGQLWKEDAENLKKSPDILATIRKVMNTLPTEWNGVPIFAGNVKNMFFKCLYSTRSVAQVLDAFVAAENGDYGGLAFMSYAFSQEIPDAANWGDVYLKLYSAGIHDPSRDYEYDMSSHSTTLGSPFSLVLFGPAKHCTVPIKTIPENLIRMQKIGVQTLFICASKDHNPYRFTRDMLLPNYKNGDFVLLSELAHSELGGGANLEVFRHLTLSFYQEGTVDDSQVPYLSVNFTPKKSFQNMAQELMKAKSSPDN